MAYYPNYNSYPYPQQFMPPQHNGLIWVQGEAGAKSHPVSAGQSVLLMDSEANRFFIKAADASGMPLPLRVFDYVERTAAKAAESAPALDTSSFVTRDEFESRIAQLSAEYNARKKVQVRKEGETNAE